MRLTPGIVGVGRGAVVSEVFREPNTNLILNPEAIDIWSSLTGVVVSANSLTNPEGVVNAEQITDGNQGSVGAATAQSQASTFPTASVSYRFSAYILAGTAPWVRLGAVNITSVTMSTWFNTATGAVGVAPGAQVTSSGSDAPITGGWRRVWTIFTMGTDLTGNMQISLVSADGAATINRNGTQTLGVWLVQLALV
jgi:hypothetical protein